MVIERLLDILFRQEHLKGGGTAYAKRWIVFRSERRVAIYIHKYLRSDWSRAMHDHPKTFVSVGLKGGYVEKTPHGVQRFTAPWVRRFPPSHAHLLRINRKVGCWTLLFTGAETRPWGFWEGDEWVPADEYLKSIGSSAEY